MPPIGEQLCTYCGVKVADIEDTWCHDCNIQFELWCDEFTDDRPCND